MQYLVLGMHRSGTSAVARLLNLMGCHVGSPESLLKPDPHNPNGYWERDDVLRLNQKLLALFEAGAYRCGHFHPQGLAGIDLPELEDMGRRIVESLEPNRPWLIKDPRLCLTGQFWNKFLNVPHFVIVHRHPLEVASSLHARDEMPMPYGIALWEKYNLAALESTRGLPRVLISHRDLLTEPVRTGESLYRQLVAYGDSGLQPLNPEELEASIDPGLYRQRCDDSLEEEYLNHRQTRLAEALRDRTAAEWEETPRLSRQAREILVSYPETVDLRSDQNPQSEAAWAALEQWNERLPSHLERLEPIESNLRWQQERLARLEGHLERQKADLEQLNDELARRLDELAGEVSSQRRELSRQLSESRRRLDSKRAQVHEAETRLQSEIDLRASEAAAFHSRLTELKRIEQESLASLGRLESWIVELDAVIRAILDSRSWKLGSLFRELSEKLLFRRSGAPASQQSEAVMEQFEQWRRTRGGGGA